MAKSTEIMMINRTDWESFSKATGVSLDSLATIEGVVETAKSCYEWTDSEHRTYLMTERLFMGVMPWRITS